MTDLIAIDLGNGRTVYRFPPKHDIRPKRSALSMPRIATDTMDPVKSMLDGKTYDSKSALRATYKAGGVEEVGNDPSIHRMKPVPRSDPKKIEESVHKAFARVGL